MRATTVITAAMLVLLTAAGCGGGTADNGAAGGGGPAQDDPGAVTPAAVATSSAVADGDLCRYLTVDQVKSALQYTGAMASGMNTDLGYPECSYKAPDNGFVRVDVWLRPGRSDLDYAKQQYTGADCGSAQAGDDSLVCPRSNPGRVIFSKGDQEINVTVTNVQSITQQQGADPSRAATTLARLIAGQL